MSVKDWSGLSDGMNTAQVTVTGTSQGQPSMSVTVFFNAVKASPASDFHGTVRSPLTPVPLS